MKRKMLFLGHDAALEGHPSGECENWCKKVKNLGKWLKKSRQIFWERNRKYSRASKNLVGPGHPTASALHATRWMDVVGLNGRVGNDMNRWLYLVLLLMWHWLPPPRFSVSFKILYRVIQRLIQHCFLSEIVYLNVNYVIATRNYEFFNTGTGP